MRTRDRLALARWRATPTVGDWEALARSPRGEDRYWYEVWEELDRLCGRPRSSLDQFYETFKAAYLPMRSVAWRRSVAWPGVG